MGKSVPKPQKKNEIFHDFVTFLNNLQVVDCFPALEQFQSILGLGNRLVEHDPWKSHISAFDLLVILSAHVRRYGLAECGDVPTTVATHLGEKRFKQFRNDVCKYLRSLPRNFEITFDLPSMPSWGEGALSLANNIALVERPAISPETGLKAKNAIAAALLKVPVEQHVPVALRINATGYGSGSVDATAVSSAISQLKQLFQMFRRIKPYKAGRGLRNSRMTAEVKCRVIDPAYPDEVIFVRLPVQLSSFLASVSLDENELKPRAVGLLSGPARKAETRGEKSTALLESMSLITSVLNCPESWPDADRLRSALEWGFDSQENDNQTFAFIQACIGLEALLGDDDKDEPLTTRLADRCSYILGTSHNDRAAIRKRFKKMYGVRSKVVHGRSARLSLSDAQELNSAQTMLANVIAAEANVLWEALRKAK